MHSTSAVNLCIIACVLGMCSSQRYEQQHSQGVSKADSENSKFAGAFNQEINMQTDRGLHLKKRKLRRRLQSLINPCYANGRNTPNGRFLWDVNVYNIYHQGGGISGCYDRPYMSNDILGDSGISPGATALGTILRLFAPGVLQNTLLSAAARPQYQDNTVPTGPNEFQYDDYNVDANVDPNYRPYPTRQPPIRRPNQVFYDSSGALPLTPAQLVGGVATTVNGIIQQLTGNVQPVYPSYRRSAPFG
uniref:Secreted protein n=1 Tax=Glossina austeni TaxID=7395 RepID=A0A1A9V2J3_GLOAU